MSLVYIYEKAIIEVWEALVSSSLTRESPPHFARELKLGEGLPLPHCEAAASERISFAMVLFQPLLRLF
jgi:hypothetical protein